MTPDYDCLIAYLEARLATGECTWAYDDLYDYWETSCGESFIITEGDPKENKMIYCPFCGKPIKEKKCAT